MAEITKSQDLLGNSQTAAKAFGVHLRDLRKRQNLSQKEMGELTNISSGYYGFLEQGRKKPSLKIINRLSKILNADYLEMAMRAGYEEMESRKKEMPRSEDEEVELRKREMQRSKDPVKGLGDKEQERK